MAKEETIVKGIQLYVDKCGVPRETLQRSKNFHHILQMAMLRLKFGEVRQMLGTTEDFLSLIERQVEEAGGIHNVISDVNDDVIEDTQHPYETTKTSAEYRYESRNKIKNIIKEDDNEFDWAKDIITTTPSKEMQDDSKSETYLKKKIGISRYNKLYSECENEWDSNPPAHNSFPTTKENPGWDTPINYFRYPKNKPLNYDEADSFSYINHKEHNLIMCVKDKVREAFYNH